MAHVALYREWRPVTFDEVVEQQHAVIALRQAVLTGQIAHAYLFSGTRGTGKTTLAKVFSRAINCLNPQNGNPCNECSICTGILNGSLLDVIEMDAASNNSVDTIRRICDEVVFMPSQAKFKVYIIDEVHMLSTGAFNALLKTLEEPPAHAVFILATTEPHRIPATILSRCQRYDFRRIPLPSLIARLREIADKDQIPTDDAALDMMARLAEGGMRDAISLLDQVRMTVAPSHMITRDDVLLMTGVADDDLLEQVARAILTNDAAAMLKAIDQLIMSGRDLARFLIDLAAFCRNLLVILVTPDPLSLLQITKEQQQRLVSIVCITNSIVLVAIIRSLSALNGELRWSTDSRTTLEIGLLRIMGEIISPAGNPASTAAPVMTIAHVREAAVSPPVTPAASVAPAKPVTVAAPIPRVEPCLSVEKKSDPAAASVTPEQAAPLPESEYPVSAAPDEPIDYTWTQIPEPPPESSPRPDLPPPAQPHQPVFSAGAPKETATADDNDGSRWLAIQNQLLTDGQMTMYLFSRPAAASFCEGELHLLFSDKDRINFQELSEPQNVKLLRNAATHIIGTDTPVVVSIADDPQAKARDCPVPDEPAWITRVRNAAGEFGIPIQMEENENGKGN